MRGIFALIILCFNPFSILAQSTYIETCDSVNIELVYIKGGEVLMGSPDSDTCRNTFEDPREDVYKETVDDFYISKYEITQKQYAKIVPSYMPYPTAIKNASYPVGFIAWWDAVNFCNDLSRKAGFKPYYEEENWAI